MKNFLAALSCLVLTSCIEEIRTTQTTVEVSRVFMITPGMFRFLTVPDKEGNLDFLQLPRSCAFSRNRSSEVKIKQDAAAEQSVFLTLGFEQGFYNVGPPDDMCLRSFTIHLHALDELQGSTCSGVGKMSSCLTPVQ